MKQNRKILEGETGRTSDIEDLLIGCIDDLQKEIDELRFKLSRFTQNQNVGYHDIEKFYTEEK